jgi:CRISPR-associated protein Csd1
VILRSLVDLYRRWEREGRIAPEGWEEKEIGFVVELAPDGSPRALLDLREPQGGGRARAPHRLVPKAPARTTNEVACLLWDKPEYALGVVDHSKIAGDDVPELRAKKEVEARERAARRLKLFREAVRELAAQAGEPDEGLAALTRFLEGDPLAKLREVADPATLEALEKEGGNVSFKLVGDEDLVCHRPRVREAIDARSARENATGEVAQCLVTGELGPIARLHPKIKGVRGAQTSGANLVSFNKEAFESHGFSQGRNAPVSPFAAFAYGTALNRLLDPNAGHRSFVGDVTIVFWAGAASRNEDVTCAFLAAFSSDDPNRGTLDLQALYRAPTIGVPPPIEDETEFYVLGVSAESRSRLTVRFFLRDTIRGIAGNVLRWFDDLAIVGEREGAPLSMRRLLEGLAVQGDVKNAPPLLEGELLRAAFTGGRFPERVLAEALVRMAAEQGPTPARIALVKAFLVRNQKEEVSVSLDPRATDPAYRLGRLFAVLERLQQAAVSPKATIRDRYWGSASATPAFVFPQLLSLATSHLGKLEGDQPGLAKWFERQIEEICDALPPSLPNNLSLIEQGRFAIGYWHQRHARGAAGRAGESDVAETTTEEIM